MVVQHLPGWFPGTRFQQDVAEWRPMVDSLFEKPLRFVKNGLVSFLSVRGNDGLVTYWYVYIGKRGR